jgi:hypothetical protein
MQIETDTNDEHLRPEVLTSAERRLIASIKRRQQRWHHKTLQEGFAPFFGLI